jgi:hypothetical protein
MPTADPRAASRPGYNERLFTSGWRSSFHPKGAVFLAKWLVKAALFKDAEHYTAGEVVAATFGQMKAVRRNQHKGFDYQSLASNVALHFDDVRLWAIPAWPAPPPLSLTVGITARSRAR